MEVVKKMVILSSDQNKAVKGVLKLDKIGREIQGMLNIYGENLSGSRLLIKNGGVYIDAATVSAPLTRFPLEGESLADNIEALVYLGGEALLYGSSASNRIGAAKMLNATSAKGGVTTSKTPQTEMREVAKNAVMPDDERAAKVHRPERETVKSEVMPGSESLPKTEEEAETFVNRFTEKGSGKYTVKNSFYGVVKGELENLFKVYPREDVLEAAIEGSKFAHIENGGGYYVVGLLEEAGKPRYLCYGVPAKKGQSVPEGISLACDFLSLSHENQNGYYLMYQDAITGDTLEKSL